MLNPLTFQFNQFMQQMRGVDPNQVLNRLMSSGKVNQQQINQAHKQVNDLKTQLENMRKNFGL